MRETNQTELKIRKILTEVTLNNDFLSSPVDEKLHKTGLDSVGMIELIYTIEDQFHMKIRDEEVVPENFDSIQSITRLLESKNALV